MKYVWGLRNMNEEIKKPYDYATLLTKSNLIEFLGSYHNIYGLNYHEHGPKVLGLYCDLLKDQGDDVPDFTVFLNKSTTSRDPNWLLWRAITALKRDCMELYLDQLVRDYSVSLDNYGKRLKSDLKELWVPEESKCFKTAFDEKITAFEDYIISRSSVVDIGEVRSQINKLKKNKAGFKKAFRIYRNIDLQSNKTNENNHRNQRLLSYILETLKRWPPEACVLDVSLIHTSDFWSVVKVFHIKSDKARRDILMQKDNTTIEAVIVDAKQWWLSSTIVEDLKQCRALYINGWVSRVINFPEGMFWVGTSEGCGHRIQGRDVFEGSANKFIKKVFFDKLIAKTRVKLKKMPKEDRNAYVSKVVKDMNDDDKWNLINGCSKILRESL